MLMFFTLLLYLHTFSIPTQCCPDHIRPEMVPLSMFFLQGSHVPMFPCSHVPMFSRSPGNSILKCVILSLLVLLGEVLDFEWVLVGIDGI
jgi:hypothetical protein